MLDDEVLEGENRSGFVIIVVIGKGVLLFFDIVGANEGSVSPVGSAEGKRPEFVSAKRAQTPLQGG